MGVRLFNRIFEQDPTLGGFVTVFGCMLIKLPSYIYLRIKLPSGSNIPRECLFLWGRLLLVCYVLMFDIRFCLMVLFYSFIVLLCLLKCFCYFEKFYFLISVNLILNSPPSFTVLYSSDSGLLLSEIYCRFFRTGTKSSITLQTSPQIHSVTTTVSILNPSLVTVGTSSSTPSFNFSPSGSFFNIINPQ